MLGLALAFAAVLPVSASHGSFPGANGQLAYMKYGDEFAELWVSTPDGSVQVQRTDDGEGTIDGIAWSAGGEQIVYSAGEYGKADLWVMDADGSGKRQLTKTTGTAEIYPSFSPSGTKIVYTAFTREPYTNSIWIYDMVAGKATPITPALSDQDSDPVWSPDGQRIAFMRNGELVTTDAEGKDLQYVAKKPADEPRPYNTAPDWSPDGKRIAFSHYRDLGTEDPRTAIQVVSSTGGPVETLTDYSSFRSDLAWSPDGTRIAYWDKVDNQPGTHVLDLNSKTSSLLIPDAARVAWGTNTSIPQPNPGGPPKEEGPCEPEIGCGVGPPPASPPDPPPAKSSGSECKGYEVKLGDYLQAKASCFTRDGSVYTAKLDGTLNKKVRINGMDIEGAGNGTVGVRIDVANLSVATTGKVKVKLGGFTVWQSGGEWSWKVPKSAIPKITLGEAFPGFEIGGLAVKGRVDFELYKYGAIFDVNVELPATLGGVTAQAKLRADMETGVRLEKFEAKAGPLFLGPVEIREAKLYYYWNQDKVWQGSAKIVIPTNTGPVISGGMTIVNGRFRSAWAEVDNLNVQLAREALYLQRIRMRAGIDPLSLGGGIGVSFGPQVGGKEAGSIDGDFDVSFGDPLTLAFSGKFELVEIELVNGQVVYKAGVPGSVAFSGGVGLPFDPEKKETFFGFRADVTVTGYASGSALEAGGKGTLKVPGVDKAVGAEGLVSHKGVAACTTVEGTVPVVDKQLPPNTVGFAMDWDDTLPELFASGCSVAAWKAKQSARGRAAAIDSVQVPDAKLATLAFEGDSGPPQVVLRGPGGEKIEAPADGAPLFSKAGAVIQVPEQRTTYVALASPASGRWTLAVRDGSPAVASVRQAEGLPDPAVKASVGGKGHNRKLTWSFKERAGQVVRFTDGATGALIATATKDGSKRFKPADGAKGTREVIAWVEQDGMSRGRVSAAKYAAPGPFKPFRPAGVKLRRKGGKLVVAWAPVPGVARYAVRANLSDGRKLLLVSPAKKRRVVIPGVGKRVRGKVSVQGIAAPAIFGRAKTVKLR